MRGSTFEEMMRSRGSMTDNLFGGDTLAVGHAANADVRVLDMTLSEPAAIEDASGTPVSFSAEVACFSSLDVISTPPATKRCA